MNSENAAVEVERILSADLGDLTENGHLSVMPPPSVAAWNLPDGQGLRTYGLPPSRTDELMGVVAGFQAGARPELVDRRSKLYLLGTFGAAQLGAKEGVGSVIAVPTISVIHPQLRDLHTGDIESELVNSSVDHLVEFAWRWHWLLPILAELQVSAGQAERAAWSAAKSPAERALLPDFYDGVRELCRDIVRQLRERDPEALSDDGSFWHEVVLESL